MRAAAPRQRAPRQFERDHSGPEGWAAQLSLQAQHPTRHLKLAAWPSPARADPATRPLLARFPGSSPQTRLQIAQKPKAAPANITTRRPPAIISWVTRRDGRA